MDADIVIAPDTPPIIDAVPIEKVGAVISGDYLLQDMKAVFLERIGRQRIEGGKAKQPRHGWPISARFTSQLG